MASARVAGPTHSQLDECPISDGGRVTAEPTRMSLTVMVIGGGIGGLATALSLHAAGIGVRVYEGTSKK